MIIHRPRRPELRLGYEMNAHPAANVAELRAALGRYTIPISERLAPEEYFGIVPHIGEGLSRDLRRAAVRTELKEGFEARGLFPFSVNAFPLRNFHARRVKEQVYLPSWAHHRRADLTNRIATQLAELLPEGEPATISTLGGAYRPTGNTSRRRRQMAVNYLRTVVHLARLEEEHGVSITLAVEPEPDTTFEVAADLVRFLEEDLLPTAKEILPSEFGVPKRRVEETVRSRFAVCLDVCHAAVMFREPVAEWRAFERAGLRVAKLHLTNALALPHPARNEEGTEELLGFSEPRYLHQAVGRRPDGSLWRGADLSDLAAASESELGELEEVRVHFHVPLSRARIGRLRTTRRETAAALKHALRHPEPPHLVIETYTWPILASRVAGPERDKALVDGIVGEFRWVLGEMSIRR